MCKECYEGEKGVTATFKVGDKVRIKDTEESRNALETVYLYDSHRYVGKESTVANVHVAEDYGHPSPDGNVYVLGQEVDGVYVLPQSLELVVEEPVAAESEIGWSVLLNSSDPVEAELAQRVLRYREARDEAAKALLG